MATKIISLLLFSSIFNISNAQIKIRPFLGVSSYWCRAVQLNGNIDSRNFMAAQNYGIELENSINKHNYGFSLKNTSIGLGVEVYENVYYKGKPLPYKSEKTGIGLLNIGLFYSYNLFNLNRKIPESNYPIGYKKQVLNIQPTIGINLLKTEKNVDWYGSVFNIYSDTTIITSTNRGWNYDPFIGKVFYGSSIDLGFKLQFYSKKRETFGIRFLANFGMIDMLKTTYSFSESYKDGSKLEASGTFASRGSNFAIDLSYPITIVNKKGERYRDRHPKN